MRYLVFVSLFLAIFLPLKTTASLPIQPDLRVEQLTSLSFERNTSTLSDSSKMALARQLPLLNSIDLEVIVIRLWSTFPEKKLAKQGSSPLDSKRIQSARQLLIHAGVPERRIYVEIKSLDSPPTKLEPVYGRKKGVVEFLYIGMCKEGYEQLCFDRQVAQPGAQPRSLRSLNAVQ